MLTMVICMTKKKVESTIETDHYKSEDGDKKGEK